MLPDVFRGRTTQPNDERLRVETRLEKRTARVPLVAGHPLGEVPVVAAVNGHAGAQFNLAICYKQGKGLQADAATAVSFYKAAAVQGHPGAQYCQTKDLRQFFLPIWHVSGPNVPT